MDTRTEEEAKRLICPLLTTPGTLMKCQGCECMAWAWDNDGFEWDWRKTRRADGISEILSDGWEWADHPSRFSDGTQRHVARRPLPRGRTGSCGALTAKVADVEISS